MPADVIAQAFGPGVAEIVLEVTDDKSVPKAGRKEKQVYTAADKSQRAKVLKLADKTSNLRAIAATPPSDWTVKQRLDYVEWARRVVTGLRGANPSLEERFDEAAESAEDSVKAVRSGA